MFCIFWLRNVLCPTTACNFSSLIWPAGSAARLSYLFVHLDLLSSEAFSFLIFFLLLFSSLALPISAFHLSMLSEVWFLNFLRSICTHTHFYAWKFSAQKLWHREAFPRTSFYTLQSKFYTSIFDVRPCFHAKKVAFDVVKNRKFTSIFDVRPSFCAKGCVCCRKFTILH